MMSIKRISFFVVLVLLVATCPVGSVSAGEGNLPAEDPQARAMFEKFTSRYREIDRHSERAMATMAIDSDIEMFNLMSGVEHQTWELTYLAPNRLRVNGDGAEIVCDGERLWAANPGLRMYAERPAPARGDIAAGLQEMLGAWGSLPPALGWLLSENRDDLASFWAGSMVITHSEAEVAGDIPSIRFDLRMTDQKMPGIEDVEMSGSMWFGVESGLLHTLRIDMTEIMRASYEKMLEDESLASMIGIDADGLNEDSFRSAVMMIKINQLDGGDVDEHAFSISDNNGYAKVDSMAEIEIGQSVQQSARNERAASDRIPRDLISMRAPKLRLKDSDGRWFDLAQERDRVVVLAVVPPLMADMIGNQLGELDDLNSAFEELPVATVALMSRTTNSFGEDNSIDASQYGFTVLFDDSYRVSSRFHASEAPTLFIIDQRGVVQAVHGLLAGMNAETVIDEVGRLLDGVQVFDDALVTERRETLNAALAVEERKAPRLLIEAVDEDRLRAKTSAGSFAFNSSARLLDVDLDGVQDVVSSSEDGRLVVYDGRDFSSRSISLESVDEPNVQVSAFTQIETSHGACWAVTTSRRSFGVGESTDTIGVYRPDGSKVWRRTLKAGGDATMSTYQIDRTFSVGDLNHDGLDEIAIGLTLSEGQFEARHALVVLNSSGDVLVIKPVPSGIQGVTIVPSSPSATGWIAVMGYSGMTMFQLER